MSCTQHATTIESYKFIVMRILVVLEDFTLKCNLIKSMTFPDILARKSYISYACSCVKIKIIVIEDAAP